MILCRSLKAPSLCDRAISSFPRTTTIASTLRGSGSGLLVQFLDLRRGWADMPLHDSFA
jgi:hypothetical protein